MTQQIRERTDEGLQSQEAESAAAAAVVAQADALDRQLSKEPLLVQSELKEAKLVSTDKGNAEAAEQQVCVCRVSHVRRCH